ncbi:[protein-PII] uridylyltransferase [Actinomadura livida]|uniref:Bifunctional uridylyltransferase/uridylyl-removing enzyme n=1 Tax=Actinomadura livida TaxID=79909 RepID=A0A7W7N0G0_9ACTN|nr:MULTISPECIES: [protein-PII] uridylyltransferase [Actinomadura]MBB4776885.1 [protein-PII] uridylyltransferase [Actinomadura catellatispora]GGT95535.1 bifunctional uridylyltransferase/uridylyl-removing enzyme [Actinomadura livida]
MTLATPRPGDRPAGPGGTGADGAGTARAALAAARASRAAELDRWLGSLLTAGGTPDGVALIAVGSHGRRDLTPGGDLDLVLLHRGRADIAGIADRIWYPVWDSGLRLDHSVRTVHEARTVARGDLKAALGLLSARRIAGAHALADELRAAVLADWRADAPVRLADLSAMCRERWDGQGELAFLQEPDLKEARGGLRDVHVMHAVAASWVASAPGGQVRDAHDLLLDVRHALHEVTGRSTDRLVLQEQEAVAHALGLLDRDVLQRSIAEAARTITYAASHLWRRVDRFTASQGRRPGGQRAGGQRPGGQRRGVERRPVGDGAVEHEGEVVLARNADLDDPALVLRVAAAAAQAGLPLAPATVSRLAEHAALPAAPWPAEARDALVALLGAGPAAIGVWEALDQAGLVVRLLPDWERVRNRPQRNPVHRFTVDRHLVEAAAGAAALTRDVSRPDLLLVGALLHDIGKGWPGDHSTSGAVVARDLGARLGFPEEDVSVLETLVRHHLLLPETATRRDIDDPVTVRTVTAAVAEVPGREREIIELLAALAIADGNATGPAAWGAWKARLVAELARRSAAALAGGTPPPAPGPGPDRLALVRHDGGAVRVSGSRITIAAPDRPGLLWRAAGVLALHRLAVKTARTISSTEDSAGTAVLDFTAVPEYGTPPDPAGLEADLRRMLADRLDVAGLLERRARSARVRPGVTVPPPRVLIVDDASRTATVIEVRAHDRPGLLWRIGQALGACGLRVRAARVDTLGAEAVDVFYVVDERGRPVEDPAVLADVRTGILASLR